MSFTAHLGVRGINPAQHFDEKWEQPVRIVEWSARIVGRDEYGNFKYAPDSVGDEICRFLWERGSRATSGWSNAWPVVLAGAAGGGGNGDGDGGIGGGGGGHGGAGFTFSGVRTNYSQGSAGINNFAGVNQDFSNGGPNAGVDVGLLNQTTPQEPGANPAGAMNSQPEPAAGDDMNGRRPVATGGGGTNECADCGDGSTGMFPVYDSGWAPDLRFKVKMANAPPGYPKPHGGGYGIAMAGTHEWSQEELFYQIDPRLIAVNKDGDPDMASTVHDMKGCEIDVKRKAALQSMMWVLKDVAGGNTIAYNIGDSGCGDSFGGAVIDKPVMGGGITIGDKPAGPGQTVVAPAGAGPGQTVAGGAERVVAFLSVHDGGFIDVGSGTCKHAKGQDADGHKITYGAHISTKARFRRNDTEDGPLRFELYEEGEDFESKAIVRLGWSGVDWAWWTTVPFHWTEEEEDEDDRKKPYNLVDYPKIVPDLLKPNPLRPNVGTPGTTNGRPNVASGGGLTQPGVEVPFVEPTIGDEEFNRIQQGGGWGHPMTPTGWQPQIGTLPLLSTMSELGVPGVVGVPQSFSGSMADTRNLGPGLADPATTEKRDANTPATAQMASFGGEGGYVAADDGYSTPTLTGASGDPFVYTQRPGQSKYRGGTGPGGFVILPPETGLQDAATGFVPTVGDVSTVYFMVGPSAWFGAGLPELANGGLSTGYSWGRDDATGDLVYRTHADTTLPVNAVKFTWATQDIAWRSGTSFWSTLTHAQTADRTHTFMDVTANVAPLLLGAGAPAATAPEGTFYWDTTNNLLYVNNDAATSWTLIAGGAGGVSGTGTNTHVAYWTGLTTISGDAGMTYDAASNKLTITGGTGPQLRLSADGVEYNEFEQVVGGGGVRFTGSTPRFSVFDSYAATLGLFAINTNTGAAAGSVVQAQVAATAGGDAYYVANISGGAAWAWGLDNSAGDAFKVSASSTLGSSDWLTIATSGATTITQWLNVGTATDAVSQGDLAAGLTGAARLVWTRTTPALYLYNSAGTIVNQLSAVAATATVFNEQGADIDLRVEGDTDANLLFADASTDRVGVGTNVPDTILETRRALATFWGQTTAGTWNNSTAPAMALTTTNTNPGGYDATFLFRQATSTGVIKTSGAITMLGSSSWTNGSVGTQTSDLLIINRDGNDTLRERMRFTLNTVVVNEQGDADTDFRVEGDTDTGLFFVDASTDRVAIGLSSAPAGKFQINTDSQDHLILSRPSATARSYRLAVISDGTLALADLTAGATRLVISTDGGWTFTPAASGTFVWNESGVDADFRVEGDADANLLVCDAGSDFVSIGGTVASATGIRLQVRQYVTDPGTSVTSLTSDTRATITANNSNYVNAVYAGGFDQSVINSGITHTGTFAGIRAEMVRYAGGATDAGTLNAQIAAHLRTGIFTGVGATATNASTYGVKVDQFGAAGTQGIVYGISIENAASGGTVSTSYGIYLNQLPSSVSAAQTIGIRCDNGSMDFRPIAGQQFVWNESGVDADFRVEGDTDANLLFVDASIDCVYAGGTSGWRFASSGGLLAQTNQRFAHGTAALTTTATEGFLHLQSCAGSPSGIPASIPSGQIPMVVDSTGTALYGYIAGSWVSLSHTAGTLTGSSTAGRVAFWSGATALAGDAGFTYDSATDALTVGGNLSVTGIAGQANVFNESGVDQDFRIEGDTAANLFVIDAGTDRISTTVSDASTTPLYDFIQSSTGDAGVRFALGSTYSYVIGIDNSDSDVLKVCDAASGSAVLGTNTLVSVSSSLNSPRFGIGPFTGKAGYALDVLAEPSTANNDPTVFRLRAKSTSTTDRVSWLHKMYGAATTNATPVSFDVFSVNGSTRTTLFVKLIAYASKTSGGGGTEAAAGYEVNATFLHTDANVMTLVGAVSAISTHETTGTMACTLGVSGAAAGAIAVTYTGVAAQDWDWHFNVWVGQIST